MAQGTSQEGSGRSAGPASSTCRTPRGPSSVASGRSPRSEAAPATSTIASTRCWSRSSGRGSGSTCLGPRASGACPVSMTTTLGGACRSTQPTSSTPSSTAWRWDGPGRSTWPTRRLPSWLARARSGRGRSCASARLPRRCATGRPSRASTRATSRPSPAQGRRRGLDRAVPARCRRGGD